MTEPHTIEIYCNDSSHEKPVEVFDCEKGRYRGHPRFEVVEGRWEAQGPSRQILVGNHYMPWSPKALAPYDDVLGLIRDRYRLRCKRCGRAGEQVVGGELMQTILDKLAELGRDKVTLTEIAAILERSASRGT